MALVALAATACGPGPGSSGPSGGDGTITFAFTPVSANACLKVTDERGVFAKHGVTMRFEDAPASGTAQIAQILNGQTTAGNGAYTGVITAVDKGLPIVITNAVDHDFDRDGQTALAAVVRADSGITSFGQLAGRTVGVNSLQGTWELALREAVAQQGGDPSAVELVVVPFADQVAALKAERVDAVYTTQPVVSSLLTAGFSSIGDAQAVSLGSAESATSVTFMAKAYVEEHPDLVRAYVAALDEGNAWCNSHPAEMAQAIARITDLPADVLARMPLPTFTVAINPAQTAAWSALLEKYGIVEDAPPADEVHWAGMPRKQEAGAGVPTAGR